MKNDGYTDEEAEILIHHKEVLQAYGIDSKSYKVTLLNNNYLINMQLDDPNIRLDFSIFFKEHSKSNLLDKTNFNLNTGSYDLNIKDKILCQNPIKEFYYDENNILKAIDVNNVIYSCK